MFTGWGGQVLYGPADAPGEGSVLIGEDPTGGVIGFWEPGPPWTSHTTDPGSLIWAELNTWDGARADEFYANLFGYHQHQIGDSRYVNYTSWSRGGPTMLARLQSTPPRGSCRYRPASPIRSAICRTDPWEQ